MNNIILKNNMWKNKNGNLEMILAKGLVKVNINWRMISPSGWDVYINGDKIKESVQDIQDAKDIAMEDIEHRAKMLATQLGIHWY